MATQLSVPIEAGILASALRDFVGEFDRVAPPDAALRVATFLSVPDDSDFTRAAAGAWEGFTSGFTSETSVFYR
jgi:hypothetical protein